MRQWILAVLFCTLALGTGAAWASGNTDLAPDGAVLRPVVTPLTTCDKVAGVQGADGHVYDVMRCHLGDSFAIPFSYPYDASVTEPQFKPRFEMLGSGGAGTVCVTYAVACCDATHSCDSMTFGTAETASITDATAKYGIWSAEGSAGVKPANSLAAHNQCTLKVTRANGGACTESSAPTEADFASAYESHQ